MSFVRARALRSLQQGLKRPVARIPAQSRTQLVARRYASGGGGGHGEPSSDLPWLISALAITPVGAYFLWPSASSSHGHGDHHDEHAEEHEEPAEESEEAPSDDSKQEEEPKADSSEDSNNDTDEANEKKKESPETAKPTGTEGDSQPKASDANKKSSGTEGSSEPTSKSGRPQTEGVTFKGKMKEDSPGMQHSSKREPDSKGGYKNRLDSGLQKDLTPSTETHAEDGRELANTSKPKSDVPGDISNKQAGMSNTPTRHSIPIHEMADKSKKGEGSPETAKSMGTVDPSRPMAESDDRGKRQ